MYELVVLVKVYELVGRTAFGRATGDFGSFGSIAIHSQASRAVEYTFMRINDGIDCAWYVSAIAKKSTVGN